MIIIPPTLKKWGAYCFRLERLSVHVSVCPSVQKNFKARISKIITARSFKLGQLIEDDK